MDDSVHENIVSKPRVSFDIYICSLLHLYCLSSYETSAIVVITVIIVILKAVLCKC